MKATPVNCMNSAPCDGGQRLAQLCKRPASQRISSACTKPYLLRLHPLASLDLQALDKMDVMSEPIVL